jgi:hypothetical protein
VGYAYLVEPYGRQLNKTKYMTRIRECLEKEAKEKISLHNKFRSIVVTSL